MDLSRILPGERGKAAEDQACRFLRARGLEFVARNYRCRHGEIDLIMRHGRDLVFVEVRYRGNRRFAGGAETVDRRKQSKLTATAMHYLQSHPDAAARPARIDVVAIDTASGENHLQWIRNAFGAEAWQS
ncbi:MAG: YraN family protein [Gammaproteobacteria bacterium]